MIAFAVALFVFVGAYGWAATRRASLSPWPTVVASLAIPLCVPLEWMWIRIAVSVFAISGAAKGWAIAHGGPRDPSMWASPIRFLVWLVLPPETTWPVDDDARARVRSQGVRRLARGLLKLPFVAVLVAIHWQWPTLHGSAFVEAFWALWLTWLAVTAIVDLVSCVPMLLGIDVDEIFDKPPLAESPKDFWSRRWNLFVHRFAMRHAFLPFGGRHHPLRATLLVFLASGLMHELYVLICLGRAHPYIGMMTAFFAIQGLAVVAQVLVQRAKRRRRVHTTLPRPVAIALHLGWMTLTGPLFFLPLGQVLPSL